MCNPSSRHQLEHQELLPVDSLGKRNDGSSSKGDEVKLIEIEVVNRMFPVATALSCFLWVFLVLMVYSLVPPEEYVYLDGAERESAAAACYIFMVTTSLSVVPMLIRGSGSGSGGGVKKEFSGVVSAAIAVQVIAICTNAMLAWFPTVVVVDPVTHARVYLIRWCEWIPLAGLMTFFSEIVDCQEGLYGVLFPVLTSLGQSLSCLMAIVFPFCPSIMSWCLSCFLSVLLYLTIFPRLYSKYKLYKTTSQPGLTLAEMERSCRIQFGYRLLSTCSIVWTILVVLYFGNMAAFRFYPESSLVKNKSLTMIFDTLFDVVAKALYMKIIVNVHEDVFDADGRARRQLIELKKMITVLWECSSDVILISVRNGSTYSTMVSPSIGDMLGAATTVPSKLTEHDDDDEGNVGAALLVKSEQVPVFDGAFCCSGGRPHLDKGNGRSDSGSTAKAQLKSASYFVDASNIPYDTGDSNHRGSVYLPNVRVHDQLNEQASKLVAASWDKVRHNNEKKRRSSSFFAGRRGSGWSYQDDNDTHIGDSSSGNSCSKRDSLVVLDLQKADGSMLKSEIKVSQHSDNAVIAIVRDVTERYRRFDAERQAHTEALARQRDAQTVNRFTRHEVKNGLLAGIELCAEVAKRVDVIKKNTTVPIDRIDEFDTSKCLGELDSCLHEILETVLAEAMAREVVHESYKPKLERVDVYDALSQQSPGMINEANRRDRFPLHVYPANMPFLSMDPQLLKYIHRNAVSNACKYGKEGGKVITEVHFFESKGEFEMDVINEAGPRHAELIEMGEAAAAAVFAQGARLELHSGSDDAAMRQRSTGDGGWISQQCAVCMGGLCTIRFDSNQTVFSFRCKVEPYKLPWRANEEFQVPAGTWGLAVDDTHIQRRMMTRIFKFLGVDESRIIVKGKSSSDIQDLDKLMLKLLSHDNSSKLLCLMDENLDYNMEGVSQRLSGSKYSEQALKKLTPAQLSRTLVLVRSANDSDDDIALYKKRTHGFFPKASMAKEKVRERLAPAWFERFPDLAVPETVTDESSIAVSEMGGMTDDGQGVSTYTASSDTKVELIRSIRKVDEMVQKDDIDWFTVWSALHALKGDLMAVDDNPAIAKCIELISDLRGASQPANFSVSWGRIREQLISEIE